MWRLDIWNAFQLKYNSTTHAVNSSHPNPRRKLHIFQQFLTNLSHKRHCDICQLQIICPPILAHITMLTFSRNIVSTHAMLHSMLLSSHNCHGIISIQITMIAADFSNVRKMRFVAGDNLFRDDSINQNWHFPCLEPFSLQQTYVIIGHHGFLISSDFVHLWKMLLNIAHRTALEHLECLSCIFRIDDHFFLNPHSACPRSRHLSNKAFRWK